MGVLLLAGLLPEQITRSRIEACGFSSNIEFLWIAHLLSVERKARIIRRLVLVSGMNSMTINLKYCRKY
jgi:hypothetical protein